MKIQKTLLVVTALLATAMNAYGMMSAERWEKEYGHNPATGASSSKKLYSSNSSEELQQINALLSKHLTTNKNLINFSKNKDVLLLIGSTGSGKTSLISYLTELDLIYDSDDSDHGINLKEETPGFEIDRGGQSVTRLPAYRLLKDTPYLLYDLPGLEDTRGTEYDLLNASFIKNIVENAKKVGFIFVEDKGTLWAKRGKALKSTVENAQRVFNVDDKNSLLVVTKVKSSWNQEKFTQSLEKDFADQLEDNSLLSKWIKSKKVLVRHKNIDSADRDVFLEKIKQLVPKQSPHIDVSTLYTDQGRLKNIIQELKQGLFSIFDIEQPIFDFKSSKELTKFVNKYPDLLYKYNESVRENTVLSLLVPLTNIKLSEWQNEANTTWENIQKKFNKQKKILLEKEKAQEEAEKERRARIKAEEVKKEQRSYHYYAPPSYSYTPSFSTTISQSSSVASAPAPSAPSMPSNVRAETYGSRTVYRDMNTGRFTQNPNK